MGFRSLPVKTTTWSAALALGFVLTLNSTGRADIIVSSGYYDLSPAQSGGGPPLPNPWINSPNTTFYGSNSDVSLATTSDPDISGLLIQNTGGTAVTLSALSITALDVLARARTPNGNLPLGNVTLLPGQNYIFAVGDGSDGGFSGQTIAATLNGINFSFPDVTTAQAPNGVLFGNNPQLGGGDETQPWTQDADLLRPAILATVPEPGSITLLGLGVIGLLGYRWRRRS
jgi:hypothetical protein